MSTPPKKNRRWLYIGLLVAAIIAVSALTFANREPEGTKVFTEEATTRTIQETVSASGKIFPQTEVKISSDVSGEIVELLVEEGDSVTAGQLLAKIDPDTYQSQVQRGVATVNSAKASQANSRSQIEASKAQVAQIEAQLQNAREIHTRNDGLYKEGVVSEADFQASLSNLRSLEANLASAKANQRSSEEAATAAGFNVKSSEATLEELRTSLRRTTIYAPVDGVVSMLNVEQGERVVGTIQMTGTEMMRIANLDAMEVRVEVSENDIPRVSVGNTVDVEVDAYVDRKFKGTVYQVASSSTTAALAENNLTSDQVTNFEVRIRIDPSSYADLISPTKPYPFRPGMSASVDIYTRRDEGVITVPIQAVTTREREDEDKTDDPSQDDLLEVVFLIEGDSVQMVEVQTGLQDDEFIQIKKGLTAGAQVVTGPYAAVARELKQGTTINLVTEEEYYESGNEK
ncbi:MAG: HlyD family secretion protein [Lewinella sp.]|jgi:HlyD family secretion protein|uniref:HlyD family secretion protein n=1 Tax=Lewinella sp. TaxID=2004506 RepID=UPI003D6A7A64